MDDGYFLLEIDLGGRSGYPADRLARQSLRRIQDITALLPRLHLLKFSELDERVAARSDRVVLRLLLQPRRQGWLFDPQGTAPSRDRPASLEEEVEAVIREVRRAPFALRRAARELERASPGSMLVRPIHELVCRKAGRQWSLQLGEEEITLDFPGLETYRADESLTSLVGQLQIVERPKVTLGGVVASGIGTLGRLVLVREGSDAAAWDELPAVGERLRAQVRLHRCVLTGRAVGGVLVAVEAPGR